MTHRLGRRQLVGIVLGGLIVAGGVVLTLTRHSELVRLRPNDAGSTSPRIEQSVPRKPRTVPVKTVLVQRGTLEHRINFTGDIEPEASVQVYSRVAGVLEELAVERGEQVTTGQFLGRIEWRELAARVDQAKALVARYRAQYTQLESGARPEELAQARDRVRKAQVALTHAKQMLERTKDLVEREFLPPQELDNATSAYHSAQAEYNIAHHSLTLIQKGAREEDRQAAKAQVQEAEAALRLTQVQLGYTTLLAPIAGVVAQRHIDRGAFVTLSTPVVTLVAMDRVKIIGRISERDLGKVQTGQRAEVKVDAYPNEVFRGEITQVSPTVDRQSRTIELEIVAENTDHRLKPGMFAHVSLIVEAYRNVLLIPKVALLQDGRGQKIFIRNEGVAHGRLVKTGFTTDHWAIVLDQLGEGEEVVVAGQEHLTDGAPVVVIGENAAAEGAKR